LSFRSMDLLHEPPEYPPKGALSERMIPQSPAANLLMNESSRWQQRQNTNSNQLDLLSKIESSIGAAAPSAASKAAPRAMASAPRNIGSRSQCDGPKKSFLRRGTGTVNQRNKWKAEQQKKEERRRAKQAGIIESRPKTQKIIMMEQWRDRIKAQQKMARKKKENGTAAMAQKEHIGGETNYLRSTKCFELTAKSKVKLLRSKGKKTGHRPNGGHPLKAAVPRPESAEKAPCDELECASQFEQFQTEDIAAGHDVAESGAAAAPAVGAEAKSEEMAAAAVPSEIGVWPTAKLPTASSSQQAPQNGYSLGRHSAVLSRQKKAAHPQYSHHRHTAILGQQRKAKRAMSETKRMFHRAATVHTMSKRDRLAAKYVDRQQNEAAVAAEKAAAQKADELSAAIANYEEKCHSAEVMKQSALEQFRKYQALISSTQSSLEQRQREFEKFKKKQERILCQKSQELERRSRALLNVPDRRQRAQIELIKAQNEEMKAEFAEKEKRYRSKLERLKKQNQTLRAEKLEIEGELKKMERERLQIWSAKQEPAEQPVAAAKRERAATVGGQRGAAGQQQQQHAVNGRAAKKKSYAVSKIDGSQRPQTQQTRAIKRELPPPAASSPAVGHRSAASNDDAAKVVVVDAAQSMNRREVHRHHHHHHHSPFTECEASSSSEDDSSSSHQSTRNGEDHHVAQSEVVVLSKRRNAVSRPPTANAEPFEQKETENEDGAESNHLPPVPPEWDPSTMSSEQFESEAVTNQQNAVQRMQHRDGKIEQIYGDGSKLILFPNGTEKYIFSNLGHEKQKQIFVKFPNGDIKKILADGAEVYFYAQNDILHVAKPDGVELFFFESQHEVHFADKTKHILFADGTKKYIFPNGEEQCIFPNR